MIRLLVALLLISSAAFGQDKSNIAGRYPVYDSAKFQDSLFTQLTIQNLWKRASVLFVTDFGAVSGDGNSDVSAFRAALSAAASSVRNKVVYAPDGIWLLDDTLDIPAGVTLKGTYERPLSHSQNYASFWGSGHDQAVTSSSVAGGGSSLFITHGSGNASGAPTITLHTNSGIDGFLMYWPNQVAGTSSTPTAYPYAIHGFHANNATIENIEMLNPYQGVFFEQVHRGTIRNVTGQPIFTGVYCAGGGDVNRLENVHFGAWYAYGNNLYNYISTTATAFKIGREDHIQLNKCFVYGYGRGIYGVSTPQYAADGFGGFTGPSAPWAQITDCSFDVVDSVIVIEAGQTHPITITGGHFVNTSGKPIVTVRSTFAGRLEFNSVYMYSSGGKYANIDGSGLVTFDKCIFSAYYSNTPSGWNAGSSSNTGITTAGTGAVAIRDCSFSSTQPQVSFASTLSRGIFLGNTVAGSLNVVNGLSVGYVIKNNVDATSADITVNANDPNTAAPVYDAFSGTASTNLTAHTPNAGGTLSQTWSKTGNLLLDGTGQMYYSAGAGVEAAYKYSTTMTSADQKGIMRLLFTGTQGQGGADDIMGIVIRGDVSGSKTGYEARVDMLGTPDPKLQLVKWSAGTATVLYNVSESTAGNGSPHTIEVSAVGSTITLKYDGVTKYSNTDATISGSTQRSIVLYGYSATGTSGWRVNDISGE